MPLRMIIFLTVFTLVLAGGHLFLYRRLFHATGLTRERRWRLLGALGLAGLALLAVGGRLVSRVLPARVAPALGEFGWLWFGVASYLFLTLLLAWGLTGLVRLRERRRSTPPAPVSQERREFLARVGAGGALLATGGLSTYGVWRAYEKPEVTHLTVKLPRLPRTLDGYRLVQVSDIHVGPLIQQRFMSALVEQVNGLEPDLVAVTGDLVDGSVDELGGHVGLLQKLRSRHGTYFITGNHEYYSDDEAWSAALSKMGLHVLRNRHVTLGDAGGAFDLVGVDDWGARRQGWERGYDLDAALRGRDPERAAVLLAHQPHGWDDAARKGIGLQLSGHTHGGQYFPFTLVVSAVWKHPAGYFAQPDSHLYVNRGTGFWGPPLRVASPPEITVITLTA